MASLHAAPQAVGASPPSRICDHAGCGKPFHARRSDARYCSDACRAAASRARRQGSGPDTSKRRRHVVAPAPSVADSTRLADLEAALAQVRDRVDALANKVADLQQVAEIGVEDRDTAADHERRLNQLEQERTTLRSRVDGRLADLEVALDDIRDELGAGKPGPGPDVSAIEALVDRVNRLEGEDAELATAIVKLRRKHQALAQDLSTLATNIGGLAEALMPGRLRR